MKTQIKNVIIAFVLLLFTFSKAKSQEYLQVGFSSAAAIPTATSSGDSVLLTCNDPSLTAAFSNYKIKEFVLEYPSVIGSSHPYAAHLSRVYKVMVAANTNNLYNSITALSSPDVYAIYKTNMPQPLNTPDDYSFTVSGGDPSMSKLLDLINAKAAWDYTRGLSCVKIGISDIWFVNHSDIDAKVTNLSSLPSTMIHPANSVWCCNTFGGNNPPHGTQVAGMAAAITNNNNGLASLGYNTKVAYYNQGCDAVYQAAVDGCKVVNCSWFNTVNSYSQFDQNLIDMAYALGTTIVAAAGNNNFGTPTDLFYPASLNHVISVTSTGHQNQVGDYSRPCNWVDCHSNRIISSATGCPLYFQHNSEVDICAPGYYVPVLGYNNGIGADLGTSLSAPQVSATAALLYAINPNFTPTQIENFIKNNAHAISGIHDNYLYAGQLGAGRLDAGAAVAAAASLSPCQPNFTDIIWSRINKAGALVPINNYECWNYNTVNFTTSTSPAALQTITWEFVFTGPGVNQAPIIRTGTSANLTFGIIGSGADIQYIAPPRRAPLQCLYNLEVYVRQGIEANCCVSAFYKEVSGTDPNVDCSIYRQANHLPLLNALAIPKINAISVYPNPAVNTITVSIENKEAIKTNTPFQIISSDGRVMQAGNLTGTNTQLNIGKLSKGIYLIKTQTGNAKFVKE